MKTTPKDNLDLINTHSPFAELLSTPEIPDDMFLYLFITRLLREPDGAAESRALERHRIRLKSLKEDYRKTKTNS